MIFRNMVLLLVAALVCGCVPLDPLASSPATQGEQVSGYTYVPLDPFSVKTLPSDTCGDSPNKKYRSLLQSLPDNAVRMSVEQFLSSGRVTYGPAGVGSKGESYRVTVDYINADTTNVPFWMSKTAKTVAGNQREYVNPVSPLPEGFVPGSEIFSVNRDQPTNSEELDNAVQYHIPVYVGIGLRVTANIEVLGGKVNISGLGAIGAEAEAENLKGSLVVQTLGVNGESIAAALPIQSELNRTTAQNAIVAVGAIKALLYQRGTVVSPRVVGLYLPFPGGKPLVNAIISELSQKRVVWFRPCNEEIPENNEIPEDPV